VKQKGFEATSGCTVQCFGRRAFRKVFKDINVFNQQELRSPL